MLTNDGDKFKIISNDFSIESKKELIKGILDSSNENIKEEVDFILGYLVKRFEFIIDSDTPIEDYINSLIDSKLSKIEKLYQKRMKN